jgi:hypothetical protein
MGRRLQFKRDMRSVQVSDKALEYLKIRKRGTEPYWRVVDRLLGEYKLKDISEISLARDNLMKVNQIYLDRIHELENKLKEKQMTLQ